jgi:hypothetical protein
MLNFQGGGKDTLYFVMSYHLFSGQCSVAILILLRNSPLSFLQRHPQISQELVALSKCPHLLQNSSKIPSISCLFLTGLPAAIHLAVAFASLVAFAASCNDVVIIVVPPDFSMETPSGMFSSLLRVGHPAAVHFAVAFASRAALVANGIGLIGAESPSQIRCNESDGKVRSESVQPAFWH